MKKQNSSIDQCFGSTFAVLSRVASLGAVCGALCLATSASYGQSVPLATNTFDVGLGSFNYQQNLSGSGNSVGWTNSSNAGGGPGEIGGTFARSDVSAFPLMADLRTVVPLNLNLSWSGRLVISDISFDGELGVGLWSSTNLSAQPSSCFVMRLREPSSPGGPFRADMGPGTETVDVPAGVPVTFKVTWTPSGLVDGSGTARLTINAPGGTKTVTNSFNRSDSYSFDMFGVGVIPVYSGDASAQCVAYFDDLVYSVPPAGPPQFLKQPTAPATVYFTGNTVTLVSVVAGDAPIGLQWKKVVGGVTNDVTDATNSVLTLAPLTTSDAGIYFLQASNSFGGGTVTNSAMVTLNVQTLTIAPSFAETGGKVVMEVENYDRNWVVNNAAWLWDTNWPSYSGDGYMVPVATGNRNENWTADPHLDYYVNFNNGGTWYIWVRGADMGSRRISMGLNGNVPVTANQIGNNTGAFGTLFSGAWTWCGHYGGNVANYARLTIPGPGNYIISVYMRNEALLLDQILLTQDPGYFPSGAETETPASSSLRVQVATPSDATLVSDANTNGQSFVGTGPKLVAASVRKGANPISKVEFYAGLVGSSSNKIGEATAFPWQVLWANYATGTNVLTAVVTDSGSGTATSAPVYARLANPYVPPYTPPLYTNDFSGAAKTFTFLKNNGVINNGVTSDFGWRSTAYAGGSAGEVGGLFYRSTDAAAQFIGVPFNSPVNFYFDGLLAAGSLIVSNTGTMDGVFWIGYSRLSDFGDQFGVRIREPGGETGSSAFRLSPAGGVDIPVPMDAPFSLEVRWQPSPVGDGYLAKTKLVTGASFGAGYAATQFVMHSQSNPSGTLSGFGMGCWDTSSTDGTRRVIVLADNLTYVVPRPKLQIGGTGNQVTLSWPYSVPAINLYYADSLEGTPVWTPAGAATHDTATGQFQKTETVTGKQFYRLQY